MSRPRKPTAMRVLEGGAGKTEAELAFVEGLPPCPDQLGPVAKAEWRRITGELAAVPGLLQKVDGAVLAGYCSSYALFLHCEAVIREGGLTYAAESKAGDELVRPRPEVLIRRDALRELRLYAQQFGFTPSSRAGLPTPPKAGKGGKLSKYVGYGG